MHGFLLLVFMAFSAMAQDATILHDASANGGDDIDAYGGLPGDGDLQQLDVDHIGPHAHSRRSLLSTTNGDDKPKGGKMKGGYKKNKHKNKHNNKHKNKKKNKKSSDYGKTKKSDYKRKSSYGRKDKGYGE